ncbi:phosphate ABC transporter ATP-binding protein, PhoT family [Proteiniborus ethanoligenes]|uniref:Phosphate ABC transporter ATP-binding protein, PhoT family n=1 Tax=Proteiniborus ethanoligenes TaxID=415015 RepID=A0A1H3S886_9FIRM|nr:phosphate ABC transporter ATP-binding protein [Proteiniborus ethanoligenes]SDZ33818.1 phosphate ABC transporter ATP-binding protein, PhoT family [Proteiniborus ethanoligenes]
MDIIELDSLNAYYGDKKILNNINMKIKKNKITAIIGPSGCGKSTLLSVLNRMLEENGGSTRGNIAFKGKDISSYDKEEIRKKIGIVFQKPTPFPMSIYKNLTYAPIYYGTRDKKKLEEIVQDKLKVSGLFEEVKQDLGMSALKLSGGQQQRLCIARALTVDPEVLLLDEPCSALDIKNTAHIEEMLLRLSQEYTIIIVTHNLSQAKRISDYTAFILDGELIEYDETEKIFNNPEDNRTKEYIEGIYG